MLHGLGSAAEAAGAGVGGVPVEVVRTGPYRRVVRGSAWPAKSCTPRNGTPALRAAVPPDRLLTTPNLSKHPGEGTCTTPGLVVDRLRAHVGVGVVAGRDPDPSDVGPGRAWGRSVAETETRRCGYVVQRAGR